MIYKTSTFVIGLALFGSPLIERASEWVDVTELGLKKYWTFLFLRRHSGWLTTYMIVPF